MADLYKTIHTSTTNMDSTRIKHDAMLNAYSQQGWEPEGGNMPLFAENMYQLVTLLCLEDKTEKSE